MKTTKLVFATNNLHKLEEVSQILGNNIELLSLKDINCNTDIPETADTLEGNALLKAQYIYNNYGLNAFADDTGMEVEALNNEPGIYSARYAGENKDSQANMLKVLQKLERSSNRKAQFRTAISLILDGKEYLFEGIIKGQIVEEKRGEAGFGYDPIFMPDGYNQTFAEMGNDIKNKISHRALAINKLSEFLK
ncbi:non-canonical purine NTP diphosphatase [Bacteroides sp. OttesenSCG-928-J23]|nr:non-canonical purine NTP diphosphatase [Bacteroides sp. OttesenSCG-928-J23]MDL2299570.1 non-canonical purine NTP diphosphatase [Bacteroides sp. OttesenSCG-928-E20]MDL2305017.1 non-canonical purine NTP diphosphatase [Bacteroides sp. OttesenSCG-928-D19]